MHPLPEKPKSDDKGAVADDDVTFIGDYSHVIDVLQEADSSNFTYEAKVFGIKRDKPHFAQTAEFKHTQFPSTEYFSTKHLHELSVSSDGNCFFRAISLFIYGTQSHHLVVRQACANELGSNSAFYASIIGDNEQIILDSAQSMLSPRAWASDVEISHMSTSQIRYFHLHYNRQY